MRVVGIARVGHDSVVTTEHPEAVPLHRQIQYLDEALKQNAIAQAALAVGTDLALPN